MQDADKRLGGMDTFLSFRRQKLFRRLFFHAAFEPPRSLLGTKTRSRERTTDDRSERKPQVTFLITDVRDGEDDVRFATSIRRSDARLLCFAKHHKQIRISYTKKEFLKR
jgi:hypothetical protein